MEESRNGRLPRNKKQEPDEKILAAAVMSEVPRPHLPKCNGQESRQWCHQLANPQPGKDKHPDSPKEHKGPSA